MDLSARLSQVLRLDPTANAISQDGAWDTWGHVTQLGAALNERLSEVPAEAFLGLIGRNDTATVATLLWAVSVNRPMLLLNHMQPDAALAEEIGSLHLAAIAAVDTEWSRPGVREAAQSTGTLALQVERGPVASVRLLTAARGAAQLGEPRRPDGDDCAVSLKTSGTTGKPKRIEITRTGLSASIEAVDRHHSKIGAPVEPRLRRGATIQMIPLAHTSAIQSILVTVAGGRQLVLLERFEPIAWAKAVRDHDVVTTGVPPAALKMILDADIDPSWLSGLRSARAGSAPLDPTLADQFEARFGVAVLQAYGATELQALASWTLKDHRALGKTKRGAVGRVHPGVEIRVVDDTTEQQLPVGSPGLLEVRTAQASATSADNGWIRTNDVARYDEDGFLWILGRADGAINRGGFKIEVSELAKVLETHESVVEAAVFAETDARLGQVPIAAVACVPDVEPPSEAELADWVRQHLEAYYVPREIHVFDALPRTIAMKPDIQALRSLIAARIAADDL